jgi:hypothetical protein
MAIGHGLAAREIHVRIHGELHSGQQMSVIQQSPAIVRTASPSRSHASMPPSHAR